MWNSNDTEERKFGENKGVTSWTWTIVCNWCVMEREGKETGRVSRYGSGGNKPVLRDWLRSLLSNWFPAVETSSSLFAFPPSLRRIIIYWESPVFIVAGFLCVPLFCCCFLGRPLFSLVVLVQCSPVSTWGRSWEPFAAFFVRRLPDVHVLSAGLRDFPVSCQFEFPKNLTKLSYCTLNPRSWFTPCQGRILESKMGQRKHYNCRLSVNFLSWCSVRLSWGSIEKDVSPERDNKE